MTETFTRRNGKKSPLTASAIRWLVNEYTTRHLPAGVNAQHLLSWAYPEELAAWGVVDYAPGLGHGHTAVSERLIRAAVAYEERQAAFGAGLPRQQWMAARLIFALETGRMEGSDGWHDAWPSVAPREMAWEEEAEREIFRAALEVGGSMLAFNPEHNAGVIAGIAELLGGPAAGNIPVDEQDAAFMAEVMPRLGVTVDDLLEASEI